VGEFSTMHCKNLCKCHNVPPPSTTRSKYYPWSPTLSYSKSATGQTASMRNDAYPFELCQDLNCVLDGVCRDDVWIIAMQIISFGAQSQLYWSCHLFNAMIFSISLNMENFYHILPIASSNKLHFIILQWEHNHLTEEYWIKAKCQLKFL
jgi:hypothetical protein